MDTFSTARISCIRRINFFTFAATSVNHYISLLLDIINICQLVFLRPKKIAFFFDTKPLFSFVKNKLIQIQNTMF